MTEQAGPFRGRRVLVTGHTGFKGSWLSVAARLRRSRTCRADLPRLCGDEVPEVRAAALAALGAMGPGPEGEEAIRRSLSDPSADVRLEALRALARVPAARALPEIRAVSARPENQSAAFSRETIFVLAVHGDAGAVAALAGLLGHRDSAFRQTVADRLRVLTGRDPGTEPTAGAAFLDWWTAERSRYTPPEGFATDR